MDEIYFEAMNRDEYPTKKTIYVVSYLTGVDYEKAKKVDIFATFDREKAKAYVEKFNRVLENVKAFIIEDEYEKFEGYDSPRSELYDKYYYSTLCDGAYIREIAFRK